jgi:hypothetical protein
VSTGGGYCERVDGEDVGGGTVHISATNLHTGNPVTTAGPPSSATSSASSSAPSPASTGLVVPAGQVCFPVEGKGTVYLDVLLRTVHLELRQTARGKEECLVWRGAGTDGSGPGTAAGKSGDSSWVGETKSGGGDGSISPTGSWQWQWRRELRWWEHHVGGMVSLGGSEASKVVAAARTPPTGSGWYEYRHWRGEEGGGRKRMLVAHFVREEVKDEEESPRQRWYRRRPKQPAQPTYCWSEGYPPINDQVWGVCFAGVKLLTTRAPTRQQQTRAVVDNELI